MRVIDIARKSTTNRIQKCCTIMGKKEGFSLSMGQMLYPCMQCADIFHMELDICQLGKDQRKVNMLARDYHKKLKDVTEDDVAPVILSSVMIPGLKKGQYKMSKSDPDSAIFMEDTAEDVTRKIMGAYCLEGELENNPVIDYTKYFIMDYFGKIKIERPAEFGGDKEYTNMEDLKNDFKEKALHPQDLKKAVAVAMNRILQPVRDHFTNDPYARSLLKTIKKYQAEMKAAKEAAKNKK